MPGAREAVQAAVAQRVLRARGQLRRLLKRPPDTRTLAEFQLMKVDNDAGPQLYRAGKFWSEINADFVDLIWAGALRRLRNEYFNRRFAGPDPCSLQVYGALLRIYYQQLLKVDEGFVSRISDPVAGGTGDQAQIAGRPISLDLLQSVEEALTLRAALEAIKFDGEPELIVELGAGYGRLAHVCRTLWPKCTYVVLDLPEALICSQTWLGQVFPDEVISYSQSRSRTLDRNTLRAHRIWCLGAQDIERLPDKGVDMFINIYSFAEMPRESVINYYNHLQRITRGIFYTKQRRLEDNKVDNVLISETTYPDLLGAHEIFRRTSTLYEEIFEAVFSFYRPPTP